MKITIELNVWENREKIFVNHWDWKSGDDVVAELRYGQLYLSDGTQISFNDFVERVLQVREQDQASNT